MANDDKQPMTKGEYRDGMKALIDGFKADMDKMRLWCSEELQRLGDGGALAAARGLVEKMTDAFEGRVCDLEKAATAPGAGGPVNALSSNVAKTARRKGEALVPVGATVIFRPHEGAGPKCGIAAIVCGAHVPRPGFPGVYSLWVLEPRKARWEENIKEGDGPGTFVVQ